MKNIQFRDKRRASLILSFYKYSQTLSYLSVHWYYSYPVIPVSSLTIHSDIYQPQHSVEFKILKIHLEIRISPLFLWSCVGCRLYFRTFKFTFFFKNILYIFSPENYPNRIGWLSCLQNIIAQMDPWWKQLLLNRANLHPIFHYFTEIRHELFVYINTSIETRNDLRKHLFTELLKELWWVNDNYTHMCQD